MFNDVLHNLQFIANDNGEIPDNTIDGELPQLPDSIHNYQLLDAFAKFFARVAAEQYEDRTFALVDNNIVSNQIYKDDLVLQETYPNYSLSSTDPNLTGEGVFDKTTNEIISVLSLIHISEPTRPY